MSKYVQLAVSLALGVFTFSAHAYHLDDHATIAAQAYREFVQCFPSVAARLNSEDLVAADLDEDLNLVQKYLFYSHFYNPHKDLHMWRKGSGDRIQDLEPSLLQCKAAGTAWTSRETDSLGYVIHHLQDMTVPAHVVPVHHSGWDGFEVYKFEGRLVSGWTCGEIAAAAPLDLSDVLKDTALETLAAVQNLRIKNMGRTNKSTRELSGVDFWADVSGDGFGHYGRLGNFFGSTSIVTSEGAYEISEGAYHEFKGQQMQAAIRSTLRALAWAFPQQSILTQN